MKITWGFIMAMTKCGYTLEDANERCEEALEAEAEELVPHFVRTLIRFRSSKSHRSSRSAAIKNYKKHLRLMNLHHKRSILMLTEMIVTLYRMRGQLVSLSKSTLEYAKEYL